jgi:hypothetical protein
MPRNTLLVGCSETSGHCAYGQMHIPPGRQQVHAILFRRGTGGFNIGGSRICGGMIVGGAISCKALQLFGGVFPLQPPQ